VATLSALESMLLDFGGSIVLVSHDRWLLDRVATGILAFEGDRRAEYHVGDFSDYRERRTREEQLAAAASTKKGHRPVASGGTPRTILMTPSPDSGNAPKKLSQKEMRELEGLFEAIEAAEEVVLRIQTRLSDPATYQSAGDEVGMIREELAVAEAEAARLTERWEDLEARTSAYEAAEG
jgi:ATP-binding cassette subfamily F protein uup